MSASTGERAIAPLSERLIVGSDEFVACGHRSVCRSASPSENSSDRDSSRYVVASMRFRNFATCGRADCECVGLRAATRSAATTEVECRAQ